MNAKILRCTHGGKKCDPVCDHRTPHDHCHECDGPDCWFFPEARCKPANDTTNLALLPGKEG